MSQQLQEIQFQHEDLDKVITDIIEGIIGNKQYEEKQVQRWINQINQAVMAKLVDMQRPFKFLLNTVIMQRKGANVALTHNNFWDSAFDQAFVILYPKQKSTKMEQSKQTIQCMITVYALSMLNGMSYTKNEILL